MVRSSIPTCTPSRCRSHWLLVHRHLQPSGPSCCLALMQTTCTCTAVLPLPGNVLLWCYCCCLAPQQDIARQVAKATVCLCLPHNMRCKLSAAHTIWACAPSLAGCQQGLSIELVLDPLVLAHCRRSSEGGSADEEHNGDRPPRAGESPDCCSCCWKQYKHVTVLSAWPTSKHGRKPP